MALTEGAVTAIVVASVVDFLATLSTILRLVHRRRSGDQWRWDDLFIVVGWLFSLSMTVNLSTEIHWAFRLDNPQSPEQQAIVFRKFLLTSYIVENFYTISVGATKLSIIFFYLRVFGTIQWMRISCNIMTGLILLSSMAFILVGIFQCTPIPRAWNPFMSGRCIVLGLFFLGQRVLGVFTDIVLLALPIKIVMQLQATIAKRLSLVFAFAMGGLVCFASVYTLAITGHMIGREVQFSDYRTLMWTVVEIELGVVCANMPFCYPLFLQAIPTSWRDRFASRVEVIVKSRKFGSNKQPVYAGRKRRSQSNNAIEWMKSTTRDDSGFVMNDIERRSVNSDEGILRDSNKIYVRQEYNVVTEEDVYPNGYEKQTTSSRFLR